MRRVTIVGSLMDRLRRAYEMMRKELMRETAFLVAHAKNRSSHGCFRKEDYEQRGESLPAAQGRKVTSRGRNAYEQEEKV